MGEKKKIEHSELIIFIKNPVLGKVKTRLAATLGDQKALEIYVKLLEHTKKVVTKAEVQKKVYYSEVIVEEDMWLGAEFMKAKQQGKDLGERMLNAFDYSFKDKKEKVVIIGSDCLDLTSEIIEEAFEKLNNHDVVIGPSEDGGYYLLGMNNLYPQLFQHKKWSTESVFIDTIEDILELGLSHYTLPTLTDIDTENDWKRALKKYEHVNIS